MTIDNELIDLYQEHKASNMDEKHLLINLIMALEGDELQHERALALVYELRDRSEELS